VRHELSNIFHRFDSRFDNAGAVGAPASPAYDNDDDGDDGDDWRRE